MSGWPVGLLTVILYSPSPSGFVHLIFFSGATFSTSKVAPDPKPRAGRLLVAQRCLAPSFELAGHLAGRPAQGERIFARSPSNPKAGRRPSEWHRSYPGRIQPRPGRKRPRLFSPPIFPTQALPSGKTGRFLVGAPRARQSLHPQGFEVSPNDFFDRKGELVSEHGREGLADRTGHDFVQSARKHELMTRPSRRSFS